MKASYYRTRARQALQGKWKTMFLLVALVQLISGGFLLSLLFSRAHLADVQTITFSGATMNLSLPTATGYAFYALDLVVSLLTCVMAVGLYRAIETLLDGGEPSARQLFPMHLLGKTIGLSILTALIALASMVPFIIAFAIGWVYESLPAVILCMPALIIPFVVITRMMMAEYHLAREPGIRAGQAIRKSFAGMKGNFWAFIGLNLSFIGWVFLQELVLNAGASILIRLPGGPLAYWVLSFVSNVLLQTYILVSQTAFFRSIADGSRAEWKAFRSEKEGYTQSEPFAEGEEVRLGVQAQPAATVLSADETVAKDMFLQHKCSRRLMQEAGLLDAYNALNPSPINEERFKREYADGLMRRFDHDPAALDDILNLCAEYALDDLLSRALQRVERHIRQQTLPDEEILNMCGRTLALLVSGRFDENPGFVERKKQQISDMADRLEARLSESSAEGIWSEALAMIRKMCQ